MPKRGWAAQTLTGAMTALQLAFIAVEGIMRAANWFAIRFSLLAVLQRLVIRCTRGEFFTVIEPTFRIIEPLSAGFQKAQKMQNNQEEWHMRKHSEVACEKMHFF